MKTKTLYRIIHKGNIQWGSVDFGRFCQRQFTFQLHGYNCRVRYEALPSGLPDWNGNADFSVEPINDPTRSEFDHFTREYLRPKELREFLAGTNYRCEFFKDIGEQTKKALEMAKRNQMAARLFDQEYSA